MEQTVNTYVILRRNGWKTADELEKAAGRSSRVGTQEMADRVRWIRSYILSEEEGGLGTVCIYQGTDPAAIAEHARLAGLPCDQIIAVTQTAIINDDPVQTAAPPAARSA